MLCCSANQSQPLPLLLADLTINLLPLVTLNQLLLVTCGVELSQNFQVAEPNRSDQLESTKHH